MLLIACTTPHFPLPFPSSGFSIEQNHIKLREREELVLRSLIDV